MPRKRHKSSKHVKGSGKDTSNHPRKMPKNVRDAATQVLDAYNDFFNHIKFRKGWAVAPFKQSHVQPLLEEAAEYVAEIRAKLDAANPEFKMRLVDGAAKEFLWSVDYDPLQLPRKFVDELTHASFCDANGYVEGLTKERIDQYLLEFRGTSNQDAEHPEDIVSLLQHRWADVSTGMQDYLDKQKAKGQSIQAEESQLYQILHLVTRLHRAIRIEQEESEDLSDNRPQEQMSDMSTTCESLALAAGEQVTTEQADQLEPSKQVEQADQSRADPQKTDSETTDHQIPLETENETETGNEQIESETAADMESDNAPPPFVTERTNSELANELEIKKIAEEVSQIREDLAKIQVKTDLLNTEMEEKELPAAKNDAQLLSKQCLTHSEALMRDLLALDDMHGAYIRPLRKSQVTGIQSLLEDVDAVQSKIQSITSALHDKEEEEQKLNAELAKKREEEKEQFVKSKVGTLRDEFAKMKLEPKFQLQKSPDSYIFSAHIPGMDKKAIELEHGNGVLSMCGQRLPTEEEEASLWRDLCDKHPDYASMSPKEQNHVVFLSGAGRFGTFKERQWLPEDAIADSISATYEGGTLSLNVPRRRRPSLHQRSMHPRQSHSPYVNPFFSNSDFWW
eukprot:JP445989.1.p1 GENE.JP445989.1~~JP445989.1.p1  ORF type:complete len:623 (-),score=66.96 JP445989.1:370-2238(-)